MRHPDDCLCLRCEPVYTGFWRVWKWIDAAIIGFVGGAVVIVVTLRFLAWVLK